MKKAILVFSVLAMLVLVMGCAKKEVPAPVPEETPTPQETIVPEVVPSEAPAVQETGDIQYGSRGILSDVKCADGKISAIITNVQSTTMKALQNSMESDLAIQVNGMRIQDFVCDKTEIEAGKSTACSDMMGKLSSKIRAKGNEVAVWFKSDVKNRGVVTVDCE